MQNDRPTLVSVNQTDEERCYQECDGDDLHFLVEECLFPWPYKGRSHGRSPPRIPEIPRPDKEFPSGRASGRQYWTAANSGNRGSFPRRISPPQRQDPLVQLGPQGLVIGEGRGIGRAGAEAADGRREEFEAFLAAVPDAEPLETDRVG
jgi:hypothetical protein